MAAAGHLEALSRMGWFRRKHVKPDGEIAAAHEEADRSLAAARRRRDTEYRRLREERRTLVNPLRDIRQSNHFADLAMEAFRKKGA